MRSLVKKCICVFSIGMFVFGVGCGNKSTVIQEGSHTREETYMEEFRTKYIQNDSFILHMEESLFSEKEIKELNQLVKNDLEVIKKESKSLKEPSIIYVVSDTLTGGIQVVENKIFCTKEQIQTGEYRRSLIQTSISIPNMWQAIGLDNYLFGKEGQSSIGIEELKNYYKNQENMATLSLIPAYFIDSFVDEDTKNMAYETANQLTSYIMDTYGIEVFLTTNQLGDYRQKWLESIEISNYVENYNFFTDEMTYVLDDSVPLIMKYKNLSFYLEPVNWMDSASEVYHVLVKWKEGYDFMFTSLEKNEPAAFELIKENIDAPVFVKVMDYDTDIISHTDDDNTIHLSRWYDFYHECVHILQLEGKHYRDFHWLYEGSAEYISLSTKSFFVDEKYKKGNFDVIVNNGGYVGKTEADKQLLDYIREYYLRKTEKPKEIKDIQLQLITEAIGRFTLLYPEVEVTEPVALPPNVRWWDENGAKGNFLTYPQAQVVVTYLSEKYGLDMVVKVEKGIITFEEAFGADELTVIQQCIDDLRKSE